MNTSQRPHRLCLSLCLSYFLLLLDWGFSFVARRSQKQFCDLSVSYQLYIIFPFVIPTLDEILEIMWTFSSSLTFCALLVRRLSFLNDSGFIYSFLCIMCFYILSSSFMLLTWHCGVLSLQSPWNWLSCIKPSSSWHSAQGCSYMLRQHTGFWTVFHIYVWLFFFEEHFTRLIILKNHFTHLVGTKQLFSKYLKKDIR